MINVVDFHKTYRETVAVAGLSFRVGPGEILGLVGPNGAGKTTTLRAVAGIIPPTQGSLAVAGHDIVADPVAAKRQMAYVPDDPKLFESLTIWEHLEFVAAAYRVADFGTKADALLRQFELEEKRNASAQELSHSHGERVDRPARAGRQRHRSQFASAGAGRGYLHASIDSAPRQTALLRPGG